jgi:RNA polymerase sigma-70 factor (ECF subfamily)
MVQESQSTSSTLLLRAARHDADAWRRLSELYGPLVFGWARRWGLQASDAGDLVQSVFLAVHRSVGSFRKEGPHGSFRGWLFTIARNKFRDQLRERSGEPQAAGGTAAHLALQAAADDLACSVLDESSHREQAWLVRRAVELMQTDFEERTWRAFLLTAVEGKSVLEVAAELGLSADSVYQARSRVLRRLRQELEGLLD